MKKLKVFTCKDHRGHWPVGAASVVVASNESEAWAMLETELARIGISDTDFTVQELPTDRPSVRILCDGEY